MERNTARPKAARLRQIADAQGVEIAIDSSASDGYDGFIRVASPSAGASLPAQDGSE